MISRSESILYSSTVLLFVLMLLTSRLPQEVVAPDPPKVLNSANVHAASKKPSYPKTLVIPKIGLETEIEIVGKDPDGLMSVPKEGISVSWYKYGPIPGNIGNAVLAGHNTVGGKPAVFFRLSELKQGDEIQITDRNGKTQIFIVYDIEVSKVEDFDVEKVYGMSNKKALNLITCHGKYDPKMGTYTHRFIAYSKLK